MNDFASHMSPRAALGGVLKAPTHAESTEIKIFIYDAHEFETYTLSDLLDNHIKPQEGKVLWVQVTGLANVDEIKALCTHFNFHSLAIEDTFSVHQRPKVDDYEHYQFIVSKYLELIKGKINVQQISLYFGEGYLVSFAERHCDINLISEKTLPNASMQLRARGADFLLYEIIDCTTDSYFPVMSVYNDKLDGFENLVLGKMPGGVLRQVQQFKHDLRSLRQVVWTNRDMLSVLLRNDLNLISDGVIVFLRDCYDHAVRQMDILESQRDSALSLIDLYLSSTANRLGQIMKVLTAISIVFMPPTFLVGVWGMNFKNMPELSWKYGYVFAWGMLILVSILPLTWLWRSGWLKQE